MRPKAISTKPYAGIAREGKPVAQRRRILEQFKVHDIPLNRRMIGQVTGYPINVVCWRVKGMIDSGLLQVMYEDKDPITNEDTEFLFPTSGEVRQMELKL
jgi:hypothetical protein